MSNDRNKPNEGLMDTEAVVGTRAIFDGIKGGEMLGAGAADLDAAVDEKVKAAGLTALPQPLADYLGLFPKAQRGVGLDSVAQGLAIYREKHGREASADTLAGILASVKGMSNAYAEKCQHQGRRHVFDDVGASAANQSNTYALTAGPVMTAVMQLLGEEIPFAGRAPAAADAGGMGNFRLGIVRGIAGSDWAEYSNKDVLDGLSGFKPYILGERVITLSTNGGGHTASFTGTVKTKTGGSTALPLMAGLSEVRVNGVTVGVEPTNGAFGSSANRGSGAGQSSLVGYYVDGANQAYNLTGSSVTPTSSGYTVTFDRDLPLKSVIELVVYADYEGHTDLMPVVGSQFDVTDYAAKPYMAHVVGSMVAMQQAQAEMGVDLFSAANMIARAKLLAERYMLALKRLKTVAKASKLSDTWDMNWSVREQQLNISQAMVDFLPVLSTQSANMAAATQDHGIEAIYVTGLLAQYIESLPATHFQPSGIPKAPGISRLGRLTNQGIDVYWMPKELAALGVLDNDDAAGTTEVLTIGRGTSTARSTLIVADPVAATLTPLASQSGNDVRSLLWGKSATELNKHPLFRQGVGYIKVTGLVNA